MNIEQARFNMIEQQIRPWDVLDQDVLNLLSIVKRENFVPAAYRNIAFADLEIPLPDGQNMLFPRVEARVLQELAIKKHEVVLEIGAGSGYMAALLAARGRSVTTVEISPELAKLAEQNLAANGVSNVQVVVGDGAFQGGDGFLFSAEQSAGAGEFEAGRLAGVEEVLLRDAHSFEHSAFAALGQSALGSVGDGQ